MNTPERPNTPLVVAERLMGEVVVKNVLCRHGIGDAAIIARQLANVGVAAFEGPLESEYKRSYDEAAYTRMVSGPLTLDTYRASNNTGGNQLATIMRGLVDSGPKTVKLIDIARGTQGWEEYQQSLKSLESFRYGMNRLPRVNSARVARNRLAGVLAVSNEARENFMYPRLKKIVEEVGRQKEPKDVGLVLGLSHLPLVQRIGEPLNPAQSLEVEKRVIEIATPATAAVIAKRSGADPSIHISRALLGDYTQRAFSRDLYTAHTRIKAMSTLDTDNWLDRIDQTIADTTQEWDVLPNLATTLRQLVQR